MFLRPHYRRRHGRREAYWALVESYRPRAAAADRRLLGVDARRIARINIQKSDLSLRPVWHRKQDRVLAHILVCFLAYVLWKFLGQLRQQAGLGNEPRRVLEELSALRVVDVVLPTKDGQEIRTRCVTEPSDHQRILLQRLGFELPRLLHPTPL